MYPTSNREACSLGIRVPLVDNNADFLQRQRELIIVGTICGDEEVLTQAQDLPQVILVGLTISRLRDMLPGVGIIALGLLEGDAYRQTVMAAGVDDVVRKAELVTDLLSDIWRWRNSWKTGALSTRNLCKVALV